jgi:uncharacterized protein involved in exopolysaccharide biosynthesis
MTMTTREQLLQFDRFAKKALACHWRKGVVAAAALAVVALLGTLLMPRSYYSEARLFVRFGRENQVDPTASGGTMVALYESRESEINSLIEILKSRAILDRVVDELGAEFVLYGKEQAGQEPGPRTQEPGGSSQNRQPTKVHQLAVQRLAKDMTIGAPRKSNIITVACKAKSPAIAQQIVAKLVEVYQEEHVRVHRSPGSYAFFEEQAKQALVSWKSAAAELRDMKDRLGIVTIEGRRKHLEDQIAEIDFKRLGTQDELKASQAKIASLAALIAKLPTTIVTQEVESASAAADGMRQTLYSLEAQEQELAAKMQEGHPKLTTVRQQVRDLRAILANQPAQKTQATEALNPARQGLEAQLLSERAQADALAARDRSLASAQQQLRGELTELNSQAVTIDALQQRIALAEANHKEYAQRLEQARINRTLDDERISSLSLVQPASYVTTASGPRRSLVLALGLVLAVASGLGIVLLAGWFNPLLTTAEQVAIALDLPLAGSVPRGSIAA